MAGTGLYVLRYRQAWAGSADGRSTKSAALPRLWTAAVVAGLALSAALHIGLAPVHFEEAAVQGIFSYIMGVAAVIIAAILVWPSRLAYLAGAGISLALIGLWAVFLLVPPPGADTVETIELVGLFTKATELAAATACALLWFRTRYMGRTHRVEHSNEVKRSF